MIECESDVARELLEELHFLVVEEPRLSGVQDQAAHHLARLPQRQGGRRMDAEFGQLPFEADLDIALRIVHDLLALLAHARGSQAMAFGRIV